jgi:DNA repair protein SbcC/Rad50
MSPIAQSFDALRQALRSLWPADEENGLNLSVASGILLLNLPSDIAAFSVFNGGSPNQEFTETYGTFRKLYREHSREWDQKTLSFVVCRSSELSEDDRFFASLEQDPLFCRKYVIRAHDDISTQRDELLRLPFLPLDAPDDYTLQRPPSAQDLLQAAGISANFARQLVESGVRSADRIVIDLVAGQERLPTNIGQPNPSHFALTPPRAHSRLTSMTVEGFRTYRDARTFDLDASVIVLYGPNGLGKTSFFDAIDYASTGRIGRLCRHQKRSPDEFARLATHLDKTPGSGNVTLRIRPGNPEAASWKLQRATGNWSTAWIEGEKADRKTVISRLTQANWLDATPRQQNLESLFRATHLFGQDEQEILTEFSHNSIIPESFISEMLALQDYAQGISKVGEVLSRLEKEQEDVEEELKRLRSERSAITLLLAEIGSAGSEESQTTPLEDALTSLRKRINEAGLTDSFLAEEPNTSSVNEWHELLSARLRGIALRIQSAQVLRNELPLYARLKNDCDEYQKQLAGVETELQKCAAEEQPFNKRLQTNARAVSEAEARRKKLDDRRKRLRLSLEAQARRDDLRKQTAALAAERDKQALARTEADGALSAAESTVSKALATQSETQRALSGVRSELLTIDKLIGELPQAEQDRKSLLDLQARLAEARTAVSAAEEREKSAAKTLQDTATSRQALLPAYERALAQQAELDRLLDSIQVHIHGDSCPLCGAHYASSDDLIDKIRRLRAESTQESDTTLNYKTLLAQENHAQDVLRVAKSDLMSVNTRVRELTDLSKKAEDRIANFQKHLSGVLKDPSADRLREELVRHQERLQKQRDASEQAAKTAAHEHQVAVKAQADGKDRRRVIQDRITDLERQIQAVADQVAQLDARISQGLPRDAEPDYDIPTEIERMDLSIEEALASIERLQLEGRELSAQQQANSSQKRLIVEKQKETLNRLAEIQAKMAAFRQRLQTLGLPEDANADDLEQMAQREDNLAIAIREILDMGRTILIALEAREKRLRFVEKQTELKSLEEAIASEERKQANLKKSTSSCSAIDRLLKRERQSAVQKHVSAYGPMITKIQQRLRSVYGFGEVQLEPRDGQAIVHVEWRGNKSVQVQPTDFFSDSQKQILMLSIFLAGGLRQNWSGFAPVLLDDPVTHFDDLNAYGFVELVRGIVATSPHEWQFMISTCEDRLFRLMQKKFSRLPSGAIFYEFTGMSDGGPIIAYSGASRPPVPIEVVH